MYSNYQIYLKCIEIHLFILYYILDSVRFIVGPSTEIRMRLIVLIEFTGNKNSGKKKKKNAMESLRGRPITLGNKT